MNQKMEEKKTDLRILRTRKNIHQAFFDLLREKPYEKITVAEISDLAMINRNTFYLHYRDKDELMENLCQEHLASFQKLLDRQAQSSQFSASLRKTVTSVLEEIDQNRAFYRVMLNNSDTRFTERLKEQIISQMMKSVPADAAGQYRIPVEFVISGFIGSIRLYLTEESSISLSELDALIWKLITCNSLEILLSMQETQ